MIDLEFVERLIRALDESSLSSLELEQEGTRVHLSKGTSGSPTTSGAPVPIPEVSISAPASNPSGTPESSGEEGSVAEAGEVVDGYLEVVSPMVGTYYAAPSPDADPYVEVGHQVGKGSVLCIIEAMKLMNELESEVEGTIAKILVDNAQPVEYGQVLFLIDPS
jgi:acetyl-CoA carboxylase biotin carboxyl carrier protein